MKQMQKLRALLAGLALLAFAATPLAANGLNLNGMGSRAMGMAGAVIAWTDDVSLFYFNPAGAMNVKTAWISLFETNLIPTSTYKFTHPVFKFTIDTRNQSKVYPACALGFIKPISDRLVIGLGVFTPSGTGAVWDGEALKNLLNPPAAYKWESFLGVVSIAPLVAYKVSEQFSLGATLNINYGFMSIKRPAVGQYEESLNGWGVGATFGFQFRPDDKVSIGMTVKLPVNVTLKGDAKMSAAGTYGLSTSSDITRKTTLPLWWGFGLAYKPSSKLTIAADFNYTNWNKLDKIGIEFADTTWNAGLQHPLLKAGFNQTLDLKWKDCLQFRLGIEYLLGSKWAVRLGYMKDPSPSPAETLNILLPQIPYDIITIGGGYSCRKWTVNAALEIVMGKDQESPLTGKLPGTHGMNIIVPNIQFTFSL